ncbi:MAG: AbrB/MazE/SpoVT family DNA-binding domain-containing protein [Candidatus Acidiferrales bacterium]
MKTQPKSARSLVAVKIGVSRQVVIPKRIHDQLGLAPGDYLEVELEGDRVVLTPKALIEKRLADGLEDIRAGRVHGPFRSVPALIRSLRKTKKTKHS